MKKKAQIISLDLVLGIMVFLIILVVFVAVFLYGRLTQKVDKYEYELDYLYRNFEVNLKHGNEDQQFLVRSRVYKDKLRAFASFYYLQSIDNLVVGKVVQANGIGLDPAAYDVCMYFTDKDNQPMEITPGITHIGQIKFENVERTCQEIISGNNNPCRDYKDSISLFKPVLFDENDEELNRILQMNLVVCKI